MKSLIVAASPRVSEPLAAAGLSGRVDGPTPDRLLARVLEWHFMGAEVICPRVSANAERVVAKLIVHGVPEMKSAPALGMGAATRSQF